MTRVPIAGVGMTKFGKNGERTARELFAEAAGKAFEDSGLSPDDVDEVYYGNFMGEIAEQQGHSGPLAADAAGVTAPATRIESACASSGAAVRHGVNRVRNGDVDVVLVGGAERMTNLSTADGTAGLAAAADALWEIKAGVTFPGAYSLMANRYFHEHGGSREDLAEVAVKNHDHAVENELAQFQMEIDVDKVLDAPTVCSPFGLFDCSPMSDGGSAALLVSEDFADDHDLGEVAITGTGQDGDRLALHDRVSMTRTPAAERAAEMAYDDAGIGPDDIDVAEVHDCFTIAEVLAIEALGFYEQGEGITAATNGETAIDGDLPVNLSGGLKAKGHPVGATGGAQISELTKILRGDHVNSDAVSDAEIGLTHNAGGTVASCVVNVLEVMN
ncbi:thiolase domain-containing protein [Salinibaculum rarum]|uniref:thiolase domain-containing protein n=1 Tax=Salinibaculum rarum TaxID=3058903 RepID=UPI00265EBCEC|nr:thiolase domain-containing protein [Salinibaculum sp. KK48]